MSRNTYNAWMMQILPSSYHSGCDNISIDVSVDVHMRLSRQFGDVWEHRALYEGSLWAPPIPRGMMDALREYIDLL